MDIISQNFVYALILTISTLGLLHVIVCLFITEFWPFNGVINLFLLSVFTFSCTTYLEIGLFTA